MRPDTSARIFHGTVSVASIIELVIGLLLVFQVKTPLGAGVDLRWAAGLRVLGFGRAGPAPSAIFRRSANRVGMMLFHELARVLDGLMLIPRSSASAC